MPDFHFIEAYEAHVKQLMATMPLDDAMSAAVGGCYQEIGDIESDILIYAGLKSGMNVVDFGCGSGRLACSLSRKIKGIHYLGIDIIDDLLDYARLKSPGEYTFVNHRKLDVPAADDSIDMICAFSLFTHLLHTETYLYMADMHRALRPKGRLVFSFLEFFIPSHWTVFEATVAQHKSNTAPHLNMFIERNAIDAWSKYIGFKVVEYVSGDQKFFNGRSLGQSVAILEK